ncbi:MAG: ATP-binding cassette domain-containing protein [Vicinamibacterales bacterium]
MSDRTATPAILELRNLTKNFGGLRPLRVRHLAVAAGDQLTLSGLDAPAAETLIHLVSGASVPDEGTVLVDGADTREIASGTEWLASLDRFGIVTHRAVFIEALPVAANMALPLTLEIEPVPDETRAEVDALADVVELPLATLDVPISTLGALDRLRVHLARALATKPRIVLLEHPTATLSDTAERETFGRALRRAASERHCGFLALTEDAAFADASGATRLALKPANGEISRVGGWWPWK